MSDWEIEKEEPASKTAASSDWVVDKEEPVAKTTPHVSQAFRPEPSFIDKLIKPRIDTERPAKNLKAPPVEDELKSLGSGAAQGAIYAVPLVGQAIGGYDIGRAGATGLHNLFSDNKLEQPTPVAEQITQALGIDHKPTTPQGEVMNLIGNFAPVSAVESAAAKVGKITPDKIKSAMNYLRGGNDSNITPQVKNITTKAAGIIADRLAQHEKATGETAKDVLERVKKARAEGRPLSPADIGGSGVTSLAGRVARVPGQAKEYVRGFLNKRDAATAERLTADIDSTLAKGSVRDTVESLADARSKQSSPLFEESFAGGSLAPLEQQYHNEFTAADKKVQEASEEVKQLLIEVNKGKAKSMTGYSPEAQAQTRAAEFKLAQKEKELAQASADKAATLEHLRQSQTDRINNVPGAVWSPRIASLLQRPDVQRGIQRGLKIEQDNAAAEGRVFNPTEYAVIGTKDGKAVIGKIPTMRLLASAKEGLDSILLEKGMRDELTGRLTKEGRAVDNMRRTLLSELKRINPKYGEALDKWAGHSANIRAIDYGRKTFANRPEDIAADFKEMTSSEQEFARLGLADALREKILKSGVGADEAKQVIKSPWAREQMRPFFKSEADFDKFVNAVTDERAMFEAQRKIMGGSETAERLGEDTSALTTTAQVLRTGLDAARGANWNVLHGLINLRSNYALRNNPELNNMIAQLLFNPKADISQIENALPAAEKKLRNLNRAAKATGAAGAVYEIDKHLPTDDEK